MTMSTSMSMSSMSMDPTMTGMDMGSMSTTAAAASATTGMSSMAGMSGMDSSMDMGGSCQVSMLWNWYTIDACFLAKGWHITSSGMFAGTCIGVILLVILLEFLRRSGKEYDRYILRQYKRSFTGPPVDQQREPSTTSQNKNATATVSNNGAPPPFRPNVFQQMIRSLFHMLQFATAYFVMLLAMYYNGYIIICIFIGAYLGHFIFGWETIVIAGQGQDATEEPTMCCG